jgi:hypothetical protein
MICAPGGKLLEVFTTSWEFYTMFTAPFHPGSEAVFCVTFSDRGLLAVAVARVGKYDRWVFFPDVLLAEAGLYQEAARRGVTTLLYNNLPAWFSKTRNRFLWFVTGNQSSFPTI